MGHWAVVVTAVPALGLGWLAGMWTFRRTLRWCPVCGTVLGCPACARRLAGRAGAGPC